MGLRRASNPSFAVESGLRLVQRKFGTNGVVSSSKSKIARGGGRRGRDIDILEWPLDLISPSGGFLSSIMLVLCTWERLLFCPALFISLSLPRYCHQYNELRNELATVMRHCMAHLP